MNNFIRVQNKKNFFQRIWDLSAVAKIIIFTSIISMVSFVLFNSSEKYLAYLALMPGNILAGKYILTLITHIFVHGGFGHLFVNMFVLFSLGSLCEKIIGQKRFLLFYLLSGVFAGILSVVLSGLFGYGIGERIFGSPNIYMVGASGAIFAIAGLYVVLLPKIKFSIIFLPFFTLPAYVMVPLALFVMWALSFAWNWPIGNAAHFGGFLAGLIYGLYIKMKYRRKIEKLQRFFDR